MSKISLKFVPKGPINNIQALVPMSPSQRPVTRIFHVFFICAWTNGWVNNRDASDLWRHCAHYDATESLHTLTIYIYLLFNMDCGVISNPLQWHHNERDCVSDHQPHDCLLNRLFRRKSKKTSKLRVTGLCDGNSPVTQKMLPFDNVIMESKNKLAGFKPRRLEKLCSSTSNLSIETMLSCLTQNLSC